MIVNFSERFYSIKDLEIFLKCVMLRNAEVLINGKNITVEHRDVELKVD